MSQLLPARVYKAAWTHERATAEILKGDGTQFDPLVVAAFHHDIEELRRIATHRPEARTAREAA